MRNAETLEVIQNLSEDDEDDFNYKIYSVTVSPDSMTITSGHDGGFVRLWVRGGVERFECAKTLEDHEYMMFEQ